MNRWLLTTLLLLGIAASACSSMDAVAEDEPTSTPTTSSTLAPPTTTAIDLAPTSQPVASASQPSDDTYTSRIRSSAMESAIPEGEVISVDPNAYVNSPIERFDIILYRQTGADGSIDEYVHRVLALDGELLEYNGFDGLSIDGVEVDQPATVQRPTSWFGSVTIPEGHVFVMGDNRPASLDQDSRAFGPIAHLNIIGKVASDNSEMPARVILDGSGCTSSIPRTWPTGALPIEIVNDTPTSMALIIGTYADGFGRDDLVAYGRDVSVRPQFIDALEIHQLGPESAADVLFDHGAGNFFTVCMDTTDTMIVLDDLVVSG
ncbi:MAG: signal peptidase I [Acidimicrobiales bacterium]